MDIEWQEGAVCFACGSQRFSHNGDYFIRRCLISTPYVNTDTTAAHPDWFLDRDDFQLNTIKKGDYIEASELDTEQKYNDAVEVFGLFGFEFNAAATSEYCRIEINDVLLCCDNFELYQNVRNINNVRLRKLTYPQLIAIGELKRLEIEREKSNNSEKPNSCKDATNKQEVKIQKNKPVVAQVMIDLTERMEIGIKTYGEALRANNGRDALQDAYEEALDLACYLKQAMIERDNADTN